MMSADPIPVETSMEGHQPKVISMEAVSLSDPKQASVDTKAILQKLDMDPYNEDEVSFNKSET